MTPAVRTPFTPAELVAALNAACTFELGWSERPETKAIICAQVALETGNGVSCVCWNPGNYKAGPGPDTCSFLTTEWLGDPPTPQQMVCSFSAWPSLADGLGFHLHTLYTHWVEAWRGAVAGNLQAFAAGLRARGYYTAPLAAYVAGMRGYVNAYRALFGSDVAPESAPELDPAMAGWLARAGLVG